MSLRFNTAAGFLAAASLLSGSAFAFAPEFTGDLPNVIITDRVKAPNTQFDRTDSGSTATTQGIFRYTGAFDLFTYVNPRGNTQSDIKVLFTESPVLGNGSIGAVTSSDAQKVLLINGQLASSTVPVLADFTAAPSATARSANGQVDFWNTDFSGPENSTATYDYIGDKTGYNLTASGPQQRVVTLYINGPGSSTINSKSFYVFTQTGATGDELTTPVVTSPWVTAIASSSDFNGWTQGGTNLLAVIPASGNYTNVKAWTNVDNTVDIPNENPPYNALGGAAGTGPTYTPSTSPSSGNPTSLAVTINATSFGFGGWTRPSTNIVQANKVYRLRSRLASSNAASKAEFRVRFGDEYSTGQASSGYTDVNSGFATGVNLKFGNQLPTTATDYYTYLLTKGTGTTNPTNAFSYEVIGVPRNLPSADRGQEIAVSQYELSYADRSGLGSANVLANYGGTFTAASGEVAPVVANPTAFTVGTYGAQPSFGLFHINSNQPTSLTLGSGGSTLAYNTGVSSSTDPAFFSRLLGGGNITFTAGKIYIADVWLSSTAAATNPFPQLRLGLNIGNQTNFGIYQLRPIFNSAPVATAIATSPKAYHAVAEPQFTTGLTSATGDLTIDFISVGDSYTASRTITVHRVTVSEYDDFK